MINLRGGALANIEKGHFPLCSIILLFRRAGTAAKSGQTIRSRRLGARLKKRGNIPLRIGLFDCIMR
jgi:hypothetical protein